MSVSDDGEVIVVEELDNARRPEGDRGGLAMRNHIVHLAGDFRGNLVEGLRSGFPSDVGGSGDDGLSESADHAAAELMLHDTDGNGAVLVDEFVGQVVGRLVDESGGTGDVRQQVPCDERNLFDVHRQLLHGIQQDNHALFFVALLDAVDAHQRLLTGGIATDTPHSISRIQYHFALFQ